MKKHHRSLAAVAAAATLWGASFQAAAVDVVGVKIDDRAKVAGQELVLNGAGVRTRLMFKIYALGLYLGKKESTPEAVLASNGPRRITIVMLRDVSSDELGQAFMSGVNANSNKAEKSKLVNQMTAFGEIFSSNGDFKKGEVVHVDWIPDKGTTISADGKPLGEPLPDQAFYNALLRIWLGEKPVDASLKPALLGG